jgi:cytochrome c553
MFNFRYLIVGISWVTGALAADVGQPASSPSEAPLTPPNIYSITTLPVAPVNPVVRAPSRFPNRPVTPLSTLKPNIPTQPIVPAGPDPLEWDSMSKDYTAKAGELTAKFSFALTNKSKDDVVINWVRPSCGCTVAKLPPTPWKLAPKEGGTIDLSVDLRGKYGNISKYVTVDTSHGQRMLNLRISIPNTGAVAGMDNRTQNIQLAMADRQAVFKNDCARCHVAPTVDKKGEALFQAGCAVCHEAPHRATMVPDLKALKVVPTKEYWTQWITNGKVGTLMPAFASEQGGPLSKEQIESLADYLTNHYPQRGVASAAAPAPASATTSVAH